MWLITICPKSSRPPSSTTSASIHVHAWPTYKLFNRDGNLLDLKVDARDLENLAKLLDQMK